MHVLPFQVPETGRVPNSSLALAAQRTCRVNKTVWYSSNTYQVAGAAAFYMRSTGSTSTMIFRP